MGSVSHGGQFGYGHQSGWHGATAEQFKRAILSMMKGATSALTVTEMYDDRLIPMLDSLAGKGIHYYRPDQNDRDQNVVLWEDDVWDQQDGWVKVLTRRRMRNGAGHVMNPITVTGAVLRHRRLGFSSLFMSSHFPSDVQSPRGLDKESPRGRVWTDAFESRQGMQALLGKEFERHPKRCMVFNWDSNLAVNHRPSRADVNHYMPNRMALAWRPGHEQPTHAGKRCIDLSHTYGLRVVEGPEARKRRFPGIDHFGFTVVAAPKRGFA